MPLVVMLPSGREPGRMRPLSPSRPSRACAGLHTEQLALLDLLVLLRSQRLVGFAASTFSYLLAELRALRGHAKGSSLLVNPMGLPMEFFEAAARFSDPPPMWAVSFPRRT